jgi:hypothetical protein
MTTPNCFGFREFCRRNNICPETGYREVRAGRLEVVKIGRKSLVTAEAERKWLDSLPRLRLRNPGADVSEAPVS